LKILHEKSSKSRTKNDRGDDLRKGPSISIYLGTHIHYLQGQWAWALTDDRRSSLKANDLGGEFSSRRHASILLPGHKKCAAAHQYLKHRNTNMVLFLGKSLLSKATDQCGTALQRFCAPCVQACAGRPAASSTACWTHHVLMDQCRDISKRYALHCVSVDYIFTCSPGGILGRFAMRSYTFSNKNVLL
jgi:hypothetical protein